MAFGQWANWNRGLKRDLTKLTKTKPKPKTTKTKTPTKTKQTNQTKQQNPKQRW